MSFQAAVARFSGAAQVVVTFTVHHQVEGVVGIFTAVLSDISGISLHSNAGAAGANPLTDRESVFCIMSDLRSKDVYRGFTWGHRVVAMALCE